MHNILLRIHLDTRGSMTVMWALMLPVLIGSVGLAVDTGVWYSDIRKQQTAADATAMAIARSITPGVTQATLQSLAVTEAARNGYVNGNGNVTVTVTYPPNSGSYSGNTDAVSVAISRPQNRIFSVLGLSSDPTVASRAVAMATTTGGSGNACLLALKSSGSGGITFNGSVNLNASSCVIASNAPGTGSILFNGSTSGTINQLYTAGTITKHGGYGLTPTQADATGQAAIADPYSSYTPPATGSCNFNNYTLNGGGYNVTLNPGTYCSGITMNGSGTINMNPGTYIIDRGSFVTNGVQTINGTGVTIILTSSTGNNYASMTVNGSTTINMSAPTSGANAGMLIYKDRNAPSGTFAFNGSTSNTLTGAIYMPTQNITFNGSGSSGVTCTQWVASSMTFNGSLSASSSCAGTGVSAISVGNGRGSKLKE